MATPQFGAMQFVGMSGRTYSIDIYLSDVDNGQINWDSGGGASATSDQFWTPPEPVTLVGYSQVAGTADTEKLRITRNGMPTANLLRYSIHLTTLNNRPRLNLRFGAGVKVGAIQIAD